MTMLDPAIRSIVIGRLQDEVLVSQSEISRTENVNQSTVMRLWNRYQQTVCSYANQSSIRPHLTTPAQEHYIRVYHLQNRTVVATATAVEIQGLRRISSQSVCNRLRKHGIKPCWILVFYFFCKSSDIEYFLGDFIAFY